MGNKVIRIGSSRNEDANSLHPMEVFKDVSMTSYPDVKDDKAIARVQKNVNVKAVQKSLENIFTWFLGERILLPEFGTKLRTLLYEGITPMTEERIAAEIHRCVTEWEPRVSIVRIVNIGDVNDTEDNTIHLQVIFTIPQLDDQQYSYSFSYNTGAI